MSVLWFIEKPAPVMLVSKFQCEFAVRLLHSLEALDKLLHTNAPRPDAIVVSMSFGAELHEFASRHAKLLGDCKIILHQNHTDLFEDRGVYNICGNDSEHLIAMAKMIVSLNKAQSSALVLRYKEMVLNYEKMLLQIAHHDETISLPLKEARLLKLFMEHPNECLTRDQIKQQVWGNIAISGRTIDTYISKLRRYLEFGGAIIDSVYRGGYILRDISKNR